jgi:hypothetical protein
MRSFLICTVPNIGCLEIKKGNLGNLGVDGKIILNGSYGNSLEGCGLNSFGLGYGPMAGSCIHGNEPSDSIKAGDFLN